jgi:hypothetical protein
VTTELIRKITLSGVVVDACRNAGGFRARQTTTRSRGLTLASFRTGR